MKSFQFKSLLLLAALIISLPSFGQGLKAFKLKNGLSVYIWEDESKSDVFGLVGVRAGSINDPEEYTGKKLISMNPSCRVSVRQMILTLQTLAMQYRMRSLKRSLR